MQHLDAGTIHTWLDGQLPRDEAVAVEAHVAECRECADAVAEARGLILGLEPGARFAAETTRGLYLEPGFAGEREGRGLEGRVPGPFPMDTLAREGVVKFLARSHTGTAEGFLARVHPRVGHLVAVTHSAPDTALLEMARSDVNKAVALADFAAARGIDAADVVAFGDMPNDIEMLGWAGRGYAMADGHPEARAAADALAGTLDDDGVARTVERLLADHDTA